jgi:hypothetical protein
MKDGASLIKSRYLGMQAYRQEVTSNISHHSGGGRARNKRKKDQGAQERIVQMGSVLDIQVGEAEAE